MEEVERARGTGTLGNAQAVWCNFGLLDIIEMSITDFSILNTVAFAALGAPSLLFLRRLSLGNRGVGAGLVRCRMGGWVFLSMSNRWRAESS